MKYDIAETWNIEDKCFLDLLPLEEIIRVIGQDIKMCIARDEEIINIDTVAYNMPIFTRAFNEDLKKEGMERKNIHNYFSYIRDPKLRDIFSIKLPQVLLYDNLGYKESIVSLHITKIRKDEWFINDIVVKRNPNQLMKNNVASTIIMNLTELAKKDKVKYLSAYAMNKKVSEIFKSKGFIDDVRKELGHDWLMDMAIANGVQFPVYMKL